MELTPLELAVLHKLLEGDHATLIALRQQIPRLSVKARQITGVGFFTEFTLSGDAVSAPVSSPKIRFGDVEAAISGLQNGAGFLLYVDNGLLRMLEGYSYDEPWPERVSHFTLKHSDSGRGAVSNALE